MLTNIQIDNFAIIDHLDVDFQNGMTVLTGETGAGKSIIIDALSLVLGVRADAMVVRAGSKRADITASFDIATLPEVADWLKEQELDADDDCLLRRVVSKEGRSKGFINGQPATLAMMKSLGEQLVDIHGQHAHQALLRPGMQTKLLDNFGNLNEQRSEVNECWDAWKILNEEFVQLKQTEQDRHDRHELLDYQVTELDEFGISDTEISTIDAEFNKLANSNQLLEETDRQYQRLYEDEQDSAFEQVNSAAVKLVELSKLDPSLKNISEMLQGASIQIQEASQELRSYQEQLDQDPEKLRLLDQRLSQLHALGRKHRVDVKGLPELQLRLHQELKDLNNSTARADSLEQDVLLAKENFLKSATKLSKKRHQAADKMNTLISDYLRQLGMNDGLFQVDFSALEESRFNSEGTEKITFLVTANAGQPLQPITKVASGGELSRISLAIQVVTASGTSIPCLIFDEVDVGIGGGTAEVVGNLLSTIAEKAQVLCVTHQAQVASKGDHHYRLLKESDGANTQTLIDDLDSSERMEEIARMIGGIKITEQTRKHAEEMLAH